MGTISEKLTYLNDTKTKLKNVINYSGANITNDTFRSYPEKLYDKFVDFVTNGMDSLYNSLPKVTGENTELTLNNTANGVLKLDFKGNTSQDGEPTPSNPQQIHVVTGDNDVKIENKNLVDISDRSQGYINADGSINNYYGISSIHTNKYSRFDVTKPLLFSIKAKVDIFLGRFNVAFYDENFNILGLNNFGTNFTFEANEIKTISKSFNYPKAKYFRTFAYYVKKDSATTINYEIINSWENYFEYVQIEQNLTNTFTPYTSHQEQTYRVDFGGKNKVDFNNASYVAANYATVTKNSELYTVENGSSNSGGARFENIDLLLKPNTTYTVSALIVSTTAINGSCVYVSPGLRVEGTSVFGNRVGAGERSYVTFTTSNTLSTGNIALTPREANTTAVFTDIMIEENTEATRYSRYVENPIEMCEIGEYEDKLFKNTTDNPLYNADLELNKWYKYGEVGKVVLDGSETWNMSSYNASLFYNMNLFNGKYLLQNAFSNYYKNIINTNINNNQTADNILKNGEFSFRMGTKDRIYIKNTNFTDISNFKNWLSTHNTEVYYVLATPTYTLLDDTLQEQLDEIYYNAVSYEDQTNISQTNADLPFIISVSAIKNYESLEV